MIAFRKWLLVFLLLVLPIQGVAAAVAQIVCAPAQSNPSHAHDHGLAEDGAHDHSHALPHHEGSDDPGSDHSYAGHLCCHLAASALPVPRLTIASSNGSVLEARFLTLASLFDPEQPQRPPRA